ncbi:MAG TPA: TetR/AcrR family transcriptional regulator [Planctomycetota bacterium]|nr:TetR/AcrR family transcriptional regulator [Planctomycetota bacterium]
MTRSSRDAIVKTAHDLFARLGYHAVGLDHILSEVGVTKTTFYNHFESKDELVAAVLHFHDRWWRDEFQRMLRKHGGDRPRDQLLAVFDALEHYFTSEEYNGCFFINVAVQFPDPKDPAQIAARKHKEAMGDILRELAGYAGAADPAAFAAEFSMVMEGAYVTAQIQRGLSTVKTGKRLAQLLVEKHLPLR